MIFIIALVFTFIIIYQVNVIFLHIDSLYVSGISDIETHYRDVIRGHEGNSLLEQGHYGGTIVFLKKVYEKKSPHDLLQGTAKIIHLPWNIMNYRSK